MSRYILLTIVISLLLLAVLMVVIKYAASGNNILVNPWSKQVVNQSASVSTPIPVPQTPSYNPPKEFHYNSSTDLKQELETVNPQMSESDFE